MGNARPAVSVSMSGSSMDMERAVQAPLLNLDIGVSISFVAGTILDSECDRMRRMLYRITRGKALTHFLPFDQDG
jgi:hypothetical protein